MIRVVIGTEPNQYVPQKVLEYSIRTNTAADVDIRFVQQTERRMGGTNFGFVRFHVPEIVGFEGRAIYLDADQLVFGDIAELDRQLGDGYAIATVTEPEGTFGGKPVEVRNQSSVMVLDCAKLTDWRPDELLRMVVPNNQTPGPGQMRYKDFMYLGFVDQDRIQPLDPRWNHFNIIRDDTKLVHFSYVRGQPWKRPSHPLSKTWADWMKRAMAAGYLTKGELAREVLRRHIHPYYARYVL